MGRDDEALLWKGGESEEPGNLILRDSEERRRGLWLFIFCFVSIKFYFQPVVIIWLLRFASEYY